MDENKISKLVVDSAIEVHRELGGPGLLENIYEEALCQLEFHCALSFTPLRLCVTLLP